MPARLAVLGCVVQQVCKYLPEAGQVSVQEHRQRRHDNSQFMPACLNKRAACFYRVVKHSQQLDALNSQVQFSQTDAADIQQIIHQMHHLPQLPLHHAQSLINSCLVAAGPAHDLQAIANGCQRVAKFMRQRCQKSVLSAVGFGQLERLLPQTFIHPLALGYVADVALDHRLTRFAVYVADKFNIQALPGLGFER